MKLKIDGLPGSSATTLVLFGAAVASTTSYVGNKVLPPAPHLDHSYHLAQRGPAELILASFVLGAAGCKAFRYLRNL